MGVCRMYQYPHSDMCQQCDLSPHLVPLRVRLRGAHAHGALPQVVRALAVGHGLLRAQLGGGVRDGGVVVGVVGGGGGVVVVVGLVVVVVVGGGVMVIC
jgi:hypothetical protein